MPRRGAAGHGSRAGVIRITPAKVSATAPSTKPGASSTAATNAQQDDSIEALANNIAALTVDVPISNARKPKTQPIPPFRFFDLPSELRLRIYDYHFANTGDILDLDTDNYKRIHQKLAIFRTCRQVYKEASYAFYHCRAVRIFPIYGKFFRSKKPMLARMYSGQRACISTLQLRLGPGWNRPPRGWVVNEGLGLKDCVNVRRLKVFVECDPSNDVFKGFRHSDGFYEKFSQELLDDVLSAIPWCKLVEFDANPSVRKNGSMMRGLFEITASQGCRLAWGPQKGWDDGDEKEEPIRIVNHGPIGVRISPNNNNGHHGLMGNGGNTDSHSHSQGQHNVLVVA
ncbi:hypothetical protein BX600DRAFT_505462 [Xylariales sp. PMI_506]|nr:hypothetical protein BX600DRAFT_505462 [Xylariales sp. PMI_506]